MLRVFIKKMLGEPQASYTLSTKEKLFKRLNQYPNQEIHIDFPKGSMKGFSGVDELIPFDYGEWPDLINPADGMGWDLIVVPSAAGHTKNMKPVGYVNYDSDIKPHKKGNDKIIVAPSAIYSKEDKDIIDNFFNPIEHFEEVVWLK
tara:strand:- start:113 stop:550 length:438 start_codon:yes stop_codon:yes gene_type:complete